MSCTEVRRVVCCPVYGRCVVCGGGLYHCHHTRCTVIADVLPLLGERTNHYARQGAIECVYELVDALQINVVPYIVFLMVPVLGRMTDQVCRSWEMAALIM